MYKVIRFFTDLQDNRHPYNVGDVYPRDGLVVSKKRIEELAGPNNRQRRPLIKLVEEEKPQKTEEPKTQPKEGPKSERKTRKRGENSED